MFLSRKKDDSTAELNEQIQFFYKLFKSQEYIIWQNNNAENRMLYRLLLKTLKKRQNFTPLVSIIIPVYNGEKFVREAIESALAQTYKNIEIIVVNDGSTDSTEKILKSYGNKITFYTKTNGGVSSALNYGIKKMHGEYFSWLSHDDLYAPDHIENLVNWVSYDGHENDIPFSMFRLIDENSRVLFQDTVSMQLLCSDFKRSYENNEATLLEGEINGGSILIPRKAFEECGFFNESLRVAQERDFWFRLIKKYHFINIPFDTAAIRVHSNQVTNTNPNVAEESNQKNLEIIAELATKVKETPFGDRSFFLENLKRSYSNNGKKVLESYIDSLIEKE